ncbi:M14 metallopeptidase family protein [Sphingobacterium rhinopitheci]|uniref:M14 metallopeptidase family protein n=1 Tax=Sphingobacterium rhinopitheci TaxID=2781960 RepID=UPI001F520290|nr:M14 metallopeptidase family protein [Sphingobacterium rhinopitheci]MCI0920568.1 zinc carboxypeptidase [Sphingobacterium rhinopitheci]
MKKIILLANFLVLIVSAFAQIKSPEEYLGYKIGTKITPHWKMLDYYRYIATQAPNMVKYEQYGESVEGRPLYVFYVSSVANIARLEDIRSNNLKIAGEMDGAAILSNMPAILWMSNNAHGNETSSGEAAMMTLYQLIDPKNNKTKKELENTLVVIDPCLNPDGTERYNNWQNGILGTKYNPELYAREHNEPWPSGRLNHYYFDLNRDWAWQTQQESELRAKLYNSWLPHIHVDFHEQGINAPYYFPPAAEPLHEVITPWQQEFQGTIGKHNANYFDKKGWLYFTKERFDLFYPSYGDTYPVYSGAIGMTYEKAGNGSAGLGVYTADRDTLTLEGRAIEHHASGMNMLEIVSQNADRVVSEFQKFYKQANAGGLSTYQSYVIKYDPARESSMRALAGLLDKNKIRYYSSSGTFKGVDYSTKKNETYTVKEKDLIIPGNQPKGALVRVLFEPEAKLRDSVTYDITAWSLPYVYGLQGMASATKVTHTNPYSFAKINNAIEAGFGYAFKWDGFGSAQLLSALLQNKITVKSSAFAFKMNGVDFPRGSILVMTNNAKAASKIAAVKAYADKYNVQLYSVLSGILEGGKDLGSADVQTIKAPHVMMLAGPQLRALSVGEIWHYFDRQLQYPITMVNSEDIGRVKWSDVDVFIMAKGNYSFLKDKVQADAFATWLKEGGKVIALESAVEQLSAQPWSNIKAIKQDTIAQEKRSPLRKYADRERESMKEYTGGAIYKVNFDSTHPLMYGQNEYYTLKQNATLYQYFKDNKGWNIGYIKDNALMSGFVGQHLKGQLKNGLIFGAQDVDKGSVIYIADAVLFRNFWDSGKLIMANALFQVQ